MYKNLFLKLRKTPKEGSPKEFVGVVLKFVVLFFLMQIMGTFLGVILVSPFARNKVRINELVADNVYVQLLFMFLIAASAVFLVIKVGKQVFGKGNLRKELLLTNKPSLKLLGQTALVYLYYFLALVVVINFVDLFTSVNVDQTQELGIAEVTNLATKIASFFMIAIIPPVYEELLFRGFLYNSLKKKGSILASAVVTSLLFGMAHLEYKNLNWVAAIDTFVFSLFLIYASQKYKSLYSSILMHITKNSIAFYLLFIHR